MAGFPCAVAESPGLQPGRAPFLRTSRSGSSSRRGRPYRMTRSTEPLAPLSASYPSFWSPCPSAVWGPPLVPPAFSVGALPGRFVRSCGAVAGVRLLAASARFCRLRRRVRLRCFLCFMMVALGRVVSAACSYAVGRIRIVRAGMSPEPACLLRVSCHPGQDGRSGPCRSRPDDHLAASGETDRQSPGGARRDAHLGPGLLDQQHCGQRERDEGQDGAGGVVRSRSGCG